MIFSRRHWVKTLLATSLISLPGTVFSRTESISKSELPFRLSLNAYSFNQPLRAGEMSLDDLLDFTADHFIPALDLTAYYFPTYPEVPDDAFLYEIKRKAHRRGLVFSGTGVRNNFTQSDEQKRADDVQLVCNWIDAAVKLGAPMVRIFAGKKKSEDAAEEETVRWMLESIRQCAGYGKQKGIIV
ncbi:MAG: TIM barrel protein, partial [Bacteroidota bacterium]